MGKFCQLSPELWPLIDVKNLFPLSFLSIFGRFSSNFVLELILCRSGLGLKMNKFRQLSQESLPLIDFKNLFPLSFLSIFDRLSSNF